MKKIKFIVASIAVCMGITAQAQETKSAEPKGKAIVQTFGNFNADLARVPRASASSWSVPTWDTNISWMAACQ